MAGRRSPGTSNPAKLLESSYFGFVGLEGKIGAFEVCGETGEVYFSFLYTKVKVRADSLQDIWFDDNLRLIRFIFTNNQAALFEFEEDETYFNVKVECELIEEAIKARNQSGRVKDAFIYAAANFIASAADFINERSGQTLVTVTINQRVTPSQAGFGQQLAIEPPVRVGGGNQNVGQEMGGGHQNVAQSQGGGDHRNLAQERGGGENQDKRDDDGAGNSNNPNERDRVLEDSVFGSRADQSRADKSFNLPPARESNREPVFPKDSAGGDDDVNNRIQEEAATRNVAGTPARKRKLVDRGAARSGKEGRSTSSTRPKRKSRKASPSVSSIGSANVGS